MNDLLDAFTRLTDWLRYVPGAILVCALLAFLCFVPWEKLNRRQRNYDEALRRAAHDYDQRRPDGACRGGKPVR